MWLASFNSIYIMFKLLFCDSHQFCKINTVKLGASLELPVYLYVRERERET